MAYLHHEFIVIWWAELLSAALQLSFDRFGPLQFFVGTTSLAEFVDVAHHWQGYGGGRKSPTTSAESEVSVQQWSDIVDPVASLFNYHPYTGFRAEGKWHCGREELKTMEVKNLTSTWMVGTWKHTKSTKSMEKIMHFISNTLQWAVKIWFRSVQHICLHPEICMMP